MLRIHRAFFAWSTLPLATIAAVVAIGADGPSREAGEDKTYNLVAERDAGDRAEVTIDFEVGGELVIAREGAELKKLPMSVAAELAYREELVAWSADATVASRALRQYSTAKATIKSDAKGVDVPLPIERRLVVAEIGEEGLAIAGLEGPLTREQFDLVDVPANTLVLDRLLPNKAVRQGDRWEHDSTVMGPLLGMDHVAVCEVRSVVTGQQNGQLQIRLAGNVQGTIDGATTEMNLRAAYLYHLTEKRITKFNLAIEERREPGDVTPGLDVVAKLSLVSTRPAASATPFKKESLEQAATLDRPTLQSLAVDAPKRGYRFQHDAAWFVTAENRELMSMKLVRGGEFLAHCNISTQPPRPADQPKELAKFEQEVATALGERLEKIEAANEWTTASGNRCLGIVARGAVEGTPIEWRYYQVSAKNRPQATLAVTVEQSQLERLADAEKAIVESMELVPLPTASSSPATPAKPAAETAEAKTQAVVK